MRKILLLLVLVSSQLTALAQSRTVIVDLQSDLKLQAVTTALGAKVIDNIPGTSLYVLKVSSLPGFQSHALLGVNSIELDDAITLRPEGALGILTVRASRQAEWYAQQPAFKLIRADRALAQSKGRGVVIADLNSEVDFRHPALVGHLTGGHDFVSERKAKGADLDQSSASFLDQSSAAFLDQSSAAFLDQSSAAFLDQSTASFLDQSSASFLDAMQPAHGHGTFCAGLIAAVAPEAMIMPLRVFDDNGRANVSSIAKAIHYAVKHGADVINMSFGMTTSSPAVKRAIAFAIERGVIVVASAGNNDSNVPQYPAGFKDVIAAASTDLMDKKAGFSNYGQAVFVTAPGVNIISAYPDGHYALASGTSFSAPLVAGEAALLQSARRNGARHAIARGTVNIDSKNPAYAGQLGNGRIDMVRALQNLN